MAYTTIGHETVRDVLIVTAEELKALFDENKLYVDIDAQRARILGNKGKEKIRGIQASAAARGRYKGDVVAYLMPDGRYAISRGQHNCIAAVEGAETAVEGLTLEQSKALVIIVKLIESTEDGAAKEDFLDSAVVDKISKADRRRLTEYNIPSDVSARSIRPRSALVNMLTLKLKDHAVFTNSAEERVYEALNDMVKDRVNQNDAITAPQLELDIVGFLDEMFVAMPEVFDGTKTYITHLGHGLRALATMYIRFHNNSPGAVMQTATYAEKVKVFADRTDNGKRVFVKKVYPPKTKFTGERSTAVPDELEKYL